MVRSEYQGPIDASPPHFEAGIGVALQDVKHLAERGPTV